MHKLHENQSRISLSIGQFLLWALTGLSKQTHRPMGRLFEFGDSETDSTYLYFFEGLLKQYFCEHVKRCFWRLKKERDKLGRRGGAYLIFVADSVCSFTNKLLFGPLMRDLRYFVMKSIFVLIYTLFSLNFVLQKCCPCKQNDKYEVCGRGVSNSDNAWMKSFFVRIPSLFFDIWA